VGDFRQSRTDDFDKHPLPAAAVEFAVEDLLPRAEIEFALGDRDHDFAAHDLALQMGVGVVFAAAIVAIGGGGGMGRQLFEPEFVIVMQTGLVVVDEHRCGDVHGVNQTKALGNAAAPDKILNRLGDVDESSTAGDFEPEMLGQRLHSGYLQRGRQPATMAGCARKRLAFG